MRATALLATTVLMVLMPACSDSTPDPKASATASMVQAQKLEKAGQLDDAIAAYRRALALAPESFDAHYGIARTLDLAGQYDQARQHFAKAIDLAPAGVKDQTQRMMGIAWTFVGNVDEAMRYFKTVFDERLAAGNATSAAEEANEIGRVYLESGHLDLAEQWYRTGHETAAKHPDRPASEIDLDDMRWAHAEARIAARRGDERAARRNIAGVERLIDKGGNDDQRVQDAYLRGYVEFYLGQYPAAITELQKADQQDPFIVYLLGEASDKVGQPDRARACYAKVLASTSHGVNAAFVRAAARTKMASR